MGSIEQKTARLELPAIKYKRKEMQGRSQGQIQGQTISTKQRGPGSRGPGEWRGEAGPSRASRRKKKQKDKNKEKKERVNSLIHSFTHSFVHSFIHSFICLFESRYNVLQVGVQRRVNWFSVTFHYLTQRIWKNRHLTHSANFPGLFRRIRS